MSPFITRVNDEMAKKKITTRKKTKARPAKPTELIPQPSKYDLEGENYDVIKHGLPPPKYLNSRSVPILTAASWAEQEYIRLRDQGLRAQHKRDVENMIMERLARMVKQGSERNVRLAISCYAKLQEMDIDQERNLTAVIVKSLDTFVSKYIADTQAEVVRRDGGMGEKSVTTVFSEAFTAMEASGKVIVDKEVLTSLKVQTKDK